MISLDGVAAAALALPEVVEGERHGTRTWGVGGKVFAWERNFSKADLKRFGDDTPPAGPIVAVVTADLHDKEAVLAAGQRGVFTIPHFNGYAAVLLQCRAVPKKVARELLTDGWLAVAPPALVAEFTRR